MISSKSRCARLSSPALWVTRQSRWCPQIREEMVVSAHTRGGIAPEPSEPTIRSFPIPAALEEIDRARPQEGTPLGVAVQRVRRERHDPEPATAGFNNKL